jgi:hypothetical protein
MKNLVSLKKSKNSEASGEVEEYTEPEYPWGTRVSLENDSLEKMKITDLPEVGKEMMMMAKVKVVETSSRENEEGKKRRSVDLQITDMAFEEEKKDPATAIYGE